MVVIIVALPRWRGGFGLVARSRRTTHPVDAGQTDNVQYTGIKTFLAAAVAGCSAVAVQFQFQAAPVWTLNQEGVEVRAEDAATGGGHIVEHQPPVNDRAGIIKPAALALGIRYFYAPTSMTLLPDYDTLLVTDLYSTSANPGEGRVYFSPNTWELSPR